MHSFNVNQGRLLKAPPPWDVSACFSRSTIVLPDLEDAGGNKSLYKAELMLPMGTNSAGLTGHLGSRCPRFVQVRTASWGDSGLVSLVSTCPSPCGPSSVTTSQCAGGPGASPVSAAGQHAGPGGSPLGGVSLLCPHSFRCPRSVCLPVSSSGPELRLGKEELRGCRL